MKKKKKKKKNNRKKLHVYNEIPHVDISASNGFTDTIFLIFIFVINDITSVKEGHKG